ncbi:MAG: hypothetical protein ABR968_13985 [Bacteroidales bacterium]|jgi:hypothetical protein
MKIKIILVALLLSSRIVFSQGYFFGAMAGYGRCYNDQIPFNGPLYKDYINILNLSLSVSHSVKYKKVIPIISYYSGLSYQSFFPTDSTMSLIKLPIGLELQSGKKFQFLFGFGIFGEYNIHRNINQPGVYTKFQFGLNADLGFNYRINEEYSIFIKLIEDVGLTTFYKEPSYYMGGQLFSGYDNYFLNNTNINLGFNYYITNNK